MTLAPALSATSALPSVEPSSITMISACARSSARIFSITSPRTCASLKTGMTMETAQRLVMNLIDGVAAVAKTQPQAGFRKLIPQRRLGGIQIVGQIRRQKIFSDHEVGDALFF